MICFILSRTQWYLLEGTSQLLDVTETVVAAVCGVVCNLFHMLSERVS
jgi:hypothetical protein